MSRVSRAEIEAMIPHAGGMCLLDAVTSWDEQQINCSSHSHQRSDNPLRRGDQLSAVHLAEYGAQAMAVHGGLLARAAGEVAAPGFLASLRNLQLTVDTLESLPGALDVRARQLMAADSGWTYEFEISHQGESLATGRAMVMMMQEPTHDG
ncbi:MAG: phosphotransferase [Nevskiales bacterium]